MKISLSLFIKPNIFIGSLIGLMFFCLISKESLAARVTGIDEPVTTSTTATTTQPAKTKQSPKQQIAPSLQTQQPETTPPADTSRKVMNMAPAAAIAQEEQGVPVIEIAVPQQPSQNNAVTLPGNGGKKENVPTGVPAAVKTENNAAKQVEFHAPGYAPAEPAKKQAAEKYVTIDFDNVDIGVFVKFVSELTGKNFIIDDKVKGKVTIISPKKIPIQDVYKVFLSVLEVYGFAVVPAGDIIKVIPSVSAREKSVETRLKKELADPEDRIITQIITLERANPDEIKRVLDPIISKSSAVLSYPPAGMLVITDFQSNIKRLQEIVAALDVEGAGDQISYVPLQNASAGEVVKALTTIFQQRRPTMTPIRFVSDSRTNSIILLASVADTENVRKLIEMMDKDIPRDESNIQVYRLQNSISEDLVKVLTNITKDTKTAADPQRAQQAVISKNVQIVSDKATNTLVIMAEREDYKILEGIIKKLDVPRPMVYIEALIMEVNTSKAFNIGVEWRGIKNTGAVSGVDSGQSAAFIGSGGAGAAGGYNIIPPVPAIGSALAFPGGFSMGIIGAGISIGGVLFPNIGAVIQAYKTDDEVSILSTPQIMTLNNEEAEINVGENVPYITRQDQTNTGIGTGVTNYSNYEYKDVSTILKITPNINDGNLIRMKIDQQVTKLKDPNVSTGTPTTLKRTAKTTVVVNDNDTVVIAGLVGDSTSEGVSKVPFFGDIPLLGWLFKTKSSSREKTNLYVFITAHIVRTQQDARKIFDEKKGTMGEVVEGVIKLNEKKPEQKKPSQPQPLDNSAPDKTQN
jgi:general secretion pathway protein D